MTRPNILLHTFDSAMAAAWRKSFGGAPGVVVVESDILEGQCDAVVSPANSFGYMDGGIDLAYRRYFGLELQSRVQTKIKSEFRGELPVGQAMVVCPLANEVAELPEMSGRAGARMGRPGALLYRFGCRAACSAHRAHVPPPRR
jgi:Macro-like domain